MRQQTQQPEPLSVATALPPLPPIARKQLVLRYHATKPRGTMDVTHQYQSAFLLGVEAFCLSQGYRRLQDALPGIVQVFDRGVDPKTKKQRPDRFLVVIHVESIQLVFIVENIELYHNFAGDHLLVVPLLPEILHSQHGISC